MSGRVNVIALFVLGFVGIASLSVQAADTPPDMPPETSPETPLPVRRPFTIGVFWSNKVPMDKAFPMFAQAGVNVVWVNTSNYRKLAPQGLHEQALKYHLKLYVQLFGPNKHVQHSDDANYIESLRSSVTNVVDFANAQPRSHVVVGWGLGDEIEANNPADKYPNAQSHWRRYVALVRQVDPYRKLMVNHAYPPWYDIAEDEAWSSNFFVVSENKHRIDKHMAEARRLGFANHVVTIGSGNIKGMKKADWRYYKFPKDITKEQVDQRTEAQWLGEYMLTAYRGGASGLMVFVFDGFEPDGTAISNWGPHSLVDGQGKSIKGKWEAFGRAVKKIRNLEKHEKRVR